MGGPQGESSGVGMPSFLQQDASDCGAICLAYVFHYYKYELSTALIRRYTGTSQRGSTALGLVEAARSFGFTAKGVRCPAGALNAVPLPAIAHIKSSEGGQHYVVLCGTTPTHARVMDPAVGTVQTWQLSKFLAEWGGVLAILAPGLDFKPATFKKPAIARIWDLIAPQKAVLLQAFAGAVFGTILSLSTSIYVQKIVDNVIVDGNRNLLTLLSAAMLVVLAFRLLISWFQAKLILRSAQQIDAALILGYYRHLLRLPQAFFDTMRVGEITSRMSDAVKIRNFLNATFLNFLLQPLILAFALAAMFFYSWRLALFSLVLIPLNAAGYFAADWLNRKFQRQIMVRGADFDALLVESLNTQPVIRAFQLEEEMNLRTERRLVRLLRPVWDASIGGLTVGTATSLFAQAYSIALLWIGASQVLGANLTAGELMSCYTLSGYLTGPITSLLGMNASIRETLIATDRLYDIIDLECEHDTGDIELASDSIGDIRLQHVAFKYPGRLPLFRDLNLTIPSGKVTVLVGESGCGKSTILALLNRLYEPESGRIFIGDTDIRRIAIASLRNSMAVVPQQPQLFSGTVLENIAPRNADISRVLKVCRDVGILEFVEALPSGLSSLIAEGARNFSGGQKQRLALARALYVGAPILLLDEPSSAFDARSEATLKKAIRELRRSGTTIVIAAHADRFVDVADVVLNIEELKLGCSPFRGGGAEVPGERPNGRDPLAAHEFHATSMDISVGGKCA